ncbi:MAG TPA: hypothetical protein VFE50_15935 [Cyclobacteriaceae bacterium]|nr:hypothetical protein [Cyclobacteriaceae bacterium]
MKLKLNLILGALCLTAAAVSVQAQVTNDKGEAVKVKGTPYLDETYVDGTILFANNDRKAPIRYNAYKDVIEFQIDGQARALDAGSTVKRVSFGDNIFVVEKYKDDKDVTRYGYFTLLDSGKASLFSKKVMKFTPGMKGRALDGGDQPAEFRRAPDTFYFKLASGEMTEISSIKSMIAAFPDKKDELNAFAKKEKISPRDGEELKKLIEYYNSL